MVIVDFKDPEHAVYWVPRHREDSGMLSGENFFINYTKGVAGTNYSIDGANLFNIPNKSLANECFYKYEVCNMDGAPLFKFIVSVKGRTTFFHRLRWLEGKVSLFSLNKYFELVRQHLRQLGVDKIESIVGEPAIGEILKRNGFKKGKRIPKKRLSATSASMHLSNKKISYYQRRI